MSQRDRDEIRIAWGDAVYEAWRRGYNSDRVDEDRMRYDYACGHSPEECISREVRRVQPKQPSVEPEFEQEFESVSAHLNMRQIAAALRTAADYITWGQESIEDYRAYSHRFGCKLGGNVFQFVLEDALRFRGLTLDQLRVDEQEACN